MKAETRGTFVPARSRNESKYLVWALTVRHDDVANFVARITLVELTSLLGIQNLGEKIYFYAVEYICSLSLPKENVCYVYGDFRL